MVVGSGTLTVNGGAIVAGYLDIGGQATLTGPVDISAPLILTGNIVVRTPSLFLVVAGGGGGACRTWKSIIMDDGHALRGEFIVLVCDDIRVRETR